MNFLKLTDNRCLLPNVSDFFIFRVHIFAGQGDAVIFRLLLFGNQQIVFCFQKIGAVVYGKLEIVAVRDGVFRTGFDAEAAENAASVINVITRAKRSSRPMRSS
jgi:hypothetical protein